MTELAPAFAGSNQTQDYAVLVCEAIPEQFSKLEKNYGSNYQIFLGIPRNWDINAEDGDASNIATVYSSNGLSIDSYTVQHSNTGLRAGVLIDIGSSNGAVSQDSLTKKCLLVQFEHENLIAPKIADSSDGLKDADKFAKLTVVKNLTNVAIINDKLKFTDQILNRATKVQLSNLMVSEFDALGGSILPSGDGEYKSLAQRLASGAIEQVIDRPEQSIGFVSQEPSSTYLYGVKVTEPDPAAWNLFLGPDPMRPSKTLGTTDDIPFRDISCDIRLRRYSGSDIRVETLASGGAADDNFGLDEPKFGPIDGDNDLVDDHLGYSTRQVQTEASPRSIGVEEFPSSIKAVFFNDNNYPAALTDIVRYEIPSSSIATIASDTEIFTSLQDLPEESNISGTDLDQLLTVSIPEGSLSPGLPIRVHSLESSNEGSGDNITLFANREGGAVFKLRAIEGQRFFLQQGGNEEFDIDLPAKTFVAENVDLDARILSVSEVEQRVNPVNKGKMLVVFDKPETTGFDFADHYRKATINRRPITQLENGKYLAIVGARDVDFALRVDVNGEFLSKFLDIDVAARNGSKRKNLGRLKRIKVNSKDQMVIRLRKNRKFPKQSTVMLVNDQGSTLYPSFEFKQGRRKIKINNPPENIVAVQVSSGVGNSARIFSP